MKANGGGVALQQGEAGPVLEGVEQLCEVRLVAGSGGRVLVGGLQGRLVLGQQRVTDRGRGGTGQQRVTRAGLLVERPGGSHRSPLRGIPAQAHVHFRARHRPNPGSVTPVVVADGRGRGASRISCE